jgi:5-methylcytosine-specific restriction endonuclease McrA
VRDEGVGWVDGTELTTMNWEHRLMEIEDHLCSRLKLDVWEKSLYYYLLRHTRLDMKEGSLFSLPRLAKACGMSEFKVREAVRSMDRKGCIRIESRSAQGHLIRVLLPSEIAHVVPTEVLEQEIDITSLDFFTGRRYIDALVEREDGRCFYCLREIQRQTCVLDHVTPQVAGIDSSYTNVVACCHECNSMKQGKKGEDFIRALYRKGLLTIPELEERLNTLELLRLGKLVPKVR